MDIKVAAIPSLARNLDRERPGVGAASRLAAHTLSGIKVDQQINHLYGATNHSETDAILAITRGLAISLKNTEISALLDAIDIDPLPNWTTRTAGAPEIPCTWLYSACSSANHALSLAAIDMERLRRDLVCVLAADALSALAIAGFYRINAVRDNSAPPLTIESTGILIGEGACALTLKREPSSGQAALFGFGMSCDAGHQIHPEPDGIYLERAIQSALRMARISKSDVIGVIAHGTGTPANDGIEAKVLTRVFGSRTIPVTSLKGLIGHTMGASGLFNVAAAASALKDRILPPAGPSGFHSLEGIDLVLGVPRSLPDKGCLLCISSGFGGNHTALVIGVAQ
ncbi:MAG: hypothetical protein RIA09_14420 [Hoeflea sp.]|uniref:hypothetical protein n=1 Tax=Hoeflea sp. TaxID=1940281 RepID=UPI0032EAAC21